MARDRLRQHHVHLEPRRGNGCEVFQIPSQQHGRPGVRGAPCNQRIVHLAASQSEMRKARDTLPEPAFTPATKAVWKKVSRVVCIATPGWSLYGDGSRVNTE